MSVSMQAINVMRFQSIGGLKSTQDRQERQQKCASQVEFFEKQKENLKNIKCDSLEEVARKLEMFHSYEDQIAAAKQQYNNSQMQHVLDEAREIGGKIAEAAEEMAPKTPEEREKERIEEATGTEEENKGMLSEIMDEMTEVMDEMQEELEEELEEATGEELLEEVMENPQETAAADGAAVLDKESAADAMTPAEEAVTEQTVAEETVMQQTVAEETVTEQTVAEETVTEQTLAEAVEEKTEQMQAEAAAMRKRRETLEQTMIFRMAEDQRYPHIDYRL